MFYCKRCNCELTKGYTYCQECRKALRREYAKNRYKILKSEHKLKKYGVINCIYCGKEIIKTNPNQDRCYGCYLKHKHKTVDNYNCVKRSKTGRTIGRQVLVDLGFDLGNLVVHHIDENPNNNVLSNLMIINRRCHAQLHRFLEKEWSLLLKNNSSNLENCWDILRDQLTTAYLETNSANVVKITDIGQSAAEPLNENFIYIFSQEEGSETMYQASKER